MPAIRTDGFLYLVMGDTGPHNDPNGHAQNLQLLLGKLLRIDVDHAEAGAPYSIPADNPFRGEAGVRPEIWAYGFRNPWRFCFDRLTGDLWLADVGQDRVEEVDIVHRGENYGWNVFEGFEPFSNQYRKEGRTFTKPVFAYRRKYGNSITGGHVYRGDKNSSFYGAYICGDYNSKRIFAIRSKTAHCKWRGRSGRCRKDSCRSARMRRATFTRSATRARFTNSISPRLVSNDAGKSRAIISFNSQNDGEKFHYELRRGLRWGTAEF
jgi:glucose/arabinose dehydrogenase